MVPLLANSKANPKSLTASASSQGVIEALSMHVDQTTTLGQSRGFNWHRIKPVRICDLGDYTGFVVVFWRQRPRSHRACMQEHLTATQYRNLTVTVYSTKMIEYVLYSIGRSLQGRCHSPHARHHHTVFATDTSGGYK